MKIGGKSLASLHQLSELYDPSSNRQWDWQDILQKINTILQSYPNEKEAIQELHTLTAYLQNLPISSSNYGLIHYDFQLDNLFYEEKYRSFHVIDFDDAVYSWYAHDIVTALDDFLDDATHVDHLPVKFFLQGYRSIRSLSDEDIKSFPYFQRFMKLYQFSKLLWTLEGSDIVDAPQWLDDLKLKLIRARDRLRHSFCK